MSGTAFRMSRGRMWPNAQPGPRLANEKPETFLSVLAFTAPLLIWAEVSLIGRLYISELVLAGIFPILMLVRGRLLAAPQPRMFMILALAWLLAQVATDLIRGTPFIDYSRGWSKIIFFTINFMAIYMIVYGSRRRIILFALGLAFGGYLTYLLNPSDFARSQPWKFGLGVSTTLLVATLLMNRLVRGSFLLAPAAFFVMGFLGLYAGSRSLAGVTIVTGFYLLLQQVLARRNGVPAQFSTMRAFLFLFFGLMVTSAFLSLYETAASQGALGELAREKYERQSTGAFGVLLGGRSEIFVSVQAIFDSPLIGHGSWAKDPQYSAILLELEDLGYEIDYLAAESDLIPTHSHFFGAWVEAGVIGAVFWLFTALLLGLRVMSNLFLIREPLTPLIAFVGFLLIWDVLFSPFGAARRISDPYYIVVLMFAWETLRVSVPEEALMRVRKLVPSRRFRQPKRRMQPRGGRVARPPEQSR